VVAQPTLYLRPLDERDWEEWDRFVKEKTQGTVFQTSPYFKTFAEVFHRKVEVIAVYHLEEIIAGIVIFPRKKWYFNYTTLPFLFPHNEILMGKFSFTQKYQKRIKSENNILELIRQNLEKRYHFCQLYVSSSIVDMRGFAWNKWLFKPTYTISIPLIHEKNVLERISHNQRRHIRKFEKKSSDFIEFNDFSSCYRLISQSYAAHGIIPPLEKNLFKKFSEKLNHVGILKGYAITMDGETQAVMLVVEDFPVVFALFSGRNFNRDFSEAELFLYWRVLNHYREKNYITFDLLGAMSQSISRVKLELGGILHRGDELFYFRNSFFRILYYLEFYRQTRSRKLKQ
jgi:hypothetical protein